MTMPQHLEFYYAFDDNEGYSLAWRANLADARRRIADVLEDQFGELAHKFEAAREVFWDA